VERFIDGSPDQIRERLALRLISLSPHYFYDRDIRAEAERNRRSRMALAKALVMPSLTPGARVLDYGCGPGYMASAVASKAKHVDAVDISRGVLACARVLNGRSNITYQTPAELARSHGMADLAYSFAVVQHLGRQVLVNVLGLLARKIRKDGVLLLHFAVPGEGGWRSEAQWRGDRSIASWVKLRCALNCFATPAEEMKVLVSASGFTDVEVRPLAGTIAVPGDDDITRQHWLTARRG
jgi:cyclopropane fatty-acyl-phospholipid synthase-like methyltransferase